MTLKNWDPGRTGVPILHRCNLNAVCRLKDRRMLGTLTVAFGLGMITACVCPQGLTLFIAAVLLVLLGVTC